MDKKELKKMWERWLIDIESNTTKVAESVGDTQQGLSRKINNASIKYCELANIVEKYGYTIDIRKKDI